MVESCLSDEELWMSVVNSDSRAFTVLYNRYWKRLYKTVEYYLNDQNQAEQIVHDVFIILWTRRKHLDIKNFRNYIYVTARYHVLKELKAKKTSPSVEYIESYVNCDIGADSNDAENKLNYGDLKSLLLKCLKTLPKRCREIFWLSRVESRSNQEIADILHISKRTVENQITHAHKHLRDSECLSSH